MPYAHRWERGEILIAPIYLDQPFFRIESAGLWYHGISIGFRRVKKMNLGNSRLITGSMFVFRRNTNIDPISGTMGGDERAGEEILAPERRRSYILLISSSESSVGSRHWVPTQSW